MIEKFKGKYRVQSHRMPGWDYSGNGYYFITIVTQNRDCNLGEIENNEMILSNFGKIVETQWYESFEIRTELLLYQFVLMPNHLHAIIILQKLDTDDAHDTHVETHGTHVETHGRASLQPQSGPQSQPIFVRKPKSISSFVAGFKSKTTTEIDNYIDDNHLPIKKYNRFNKFWQSNYHDHIIRDEKSFYRINEYILNNPVNWKDDKFYGGKNNDPK